MELILYTLPDMITSSGRPFWKCILIKQFPAGFGESAVGTKKDSGGREWLRTSHKRRNFLCQLSLYLPALMLSLTIRDLEYQTCLKVIWSKSHNEIIHIAEKTTLGPINTHLFGIKLAMVQMKQKIFPMCYTDKNCKISSLTFSNLLLFQKCQF